METKSGGDSEQIPPPLGYPFYRSSLTIVVMFFVMVIVVAKINAYIEAIVIPVGFVIFTPMPVFVHSIDVRIDLTAVFAMAVDIAIDPGTIRFQPTVAILLPIPVSTSGTTKCQRKAAGECACQNQPTPEFITRHHCLLGVVAVAREVCPFFAAYLCYQQECCRTIGSSL
jgi:hypothetical protein